MMKFFFAILLGLIIGGSAYFFVAGDSTGDSPPKISISTLAASTPTPTPIPQVIIDSPQTLKIPSIDVEATVESVGLDSEDRMDVPKDFQNVAWYELGFKPGQKGSAVIAGHFDTPSGGPGVFYNIEELNPGDEIIVEDGQESLTYVVTDIQTYDFDKVPLNDVFDSRDKARLNLITCEGVFDRNAQNYSKRLVVYSMLKDEI